METPLRSCPQQGEESWAAKLCVLSADSLSSLCIMEWVLNSLGHSSYLLYWSEGIRFRMEVAWSGKRKGTVICRQLKQEELSFSLETCQHFGTASCLKTNKMSTESQGFFVFPMKYWNLQQEAGTSHGERKKTQKHKTKTKPLCQKLNKFQPR